MPSWGNSRTGSQPGLIALGPYARHNLPVPTPKAVFQLLAAAALVVWPSQVQANADVQTVRQRLVESAEQVLWIEAEQFAEAGGWVNDSQFVDVMGSPYRAELQVNAQ